MTDSDDIYDPEYVAALFDRCSSAYRWWSAVASFGMVRYWRVVCVRAIPESTNPKGAHDFSMIGAYTRHFKNCDNFAEALLAEGLELKSYSNFFGCATGVCGMKPFADQNVTLHSDKN